MSRRDGQIGRSVVVLLDPIDMNFLEMISANLVSGSHDGVPGFAFEDFQRDRFCVLGMTERHTIATTHEQQRANCASSHFPSRYYQVE